MNRELPGDNALINGKYVTTRAAISRIVLITKLLLNSQAERGGVRVSARCGGYGDGVSPGWGLIGTTGSSAGAASAAGDGAGQTTEQCQQAK
jgi:hypothetical protein